MPKKRYARDLLTQVLKNREESERRWLPLKETDIGDEPLAHILSDLVVSWPPRDLRFDTAYSVSHEITSVDSEYMELLARGMEVRVTKKDLATNTVEFAVDFQSNLDEYEQYNEVAKTHNKRWSDVGCPKDAFDPVKGTVKTIQDTYVDPVIPDSKHQPIPKSLYEGVSNGKLSKARPGMQRKTYVRLTYHVEVKRQEPISTYTLTVTARNNKSQVLLHYSDFSADLAALVRGSVQRLWGNTSLYGNKGPLLDGISMLLQGKKIHLSNGKLPGPVKSTVEPQKVALVAEKAGTGVGFAVFGYIIPGLSFVSLIILVVYCLIEAYLEGKTMSGTFFGGLVVSLLVVFVSLKIGGHLQAHAASLDQTERII